MELDRESKEKALQAIQGRLAASRHNQQAIKQTLQTFKVWKCHDIMIIPDHHASTCSTYSNEDCLVRLHWCV